MRWKLMGAGAVAALAVAPWWWGQVVDEMILRAGADGCCFDGGCEGLPFTMLPLAANLPLRAGRDAEAFLGACPSLWEDPDGHREALCSGSTPLEQTAAFDALVDADQLRLALAWKCDTGWNTVREGLVTDLVGSCGPGLCLQELPIAFDFLPYRSFRGIYEGREIEALHLLLELGDEARQQPNAVFDSKSLEGADLLLGTRDVEAFSVDMEAVPWLVAVAQEWLEDGPNRAEAALYLDLVGTREARPDEIISLGMLAKRTVPDRFEDPMELLCDSYTFPKQLERARVRIVEAALAMEGAAARVAEDSCGGQDAFFERWVHEPDPCITGCGAAWAVGLDHLSSGNGPTDVQRESVAHSALALLADSEPHVRETGRALLEQGGHDLQWYLLQYGTNMDGTESGGFRDITGPWVRAHPELATELLHAYEAAHPTTHRTWALRKELGLPTEP